MGRTVKGILWTALVVWALGGWSLVALIAYRNASPAVVDCGDPIPKGRHGVGHG